MTVVGRQLASRRLRIVTIVSIVIGVGAAAAWLVLTSPYVCGTRTGDVTAHAVEHGGNRYRVAEASAATMRLRLYWRNAKGAPLSNFNALERHLAQANERLVFATNAGIFHPTLPPVGLQVDRGVEHVR